jgi:hypothetical protein
MSAGVGTKSIGVQGGPPPAPPVLLDAEVVVAEFVTVCVDELDEVPPAPVDVVVEGELQAAKTANVPRNEARITESNYQGHGADVRDLSTVDSSPMFRDRKPARRRATGASRPQGHANRQEGGFPRPDALPSATPTCLYHAIPDS